jgi:hypothetical protein
MANSPHLVAKVAASSLLVTAAFWIAWTDLSITAKWYEGHSNRWISYNKHGDVLMAQDKLDGALQAYRNSLAHAELLAEADPSNSRWRSEMTHYARRLAT